MIIYDKDNSQLLVIDGYLDIGLHDTMYYLIVNFIGAIVFCIFEYLFYLIRKYKAVGKLLVKKYMKEELI